MHANIGKIFVMPIKILYCIVNRERKIIPSYSIGALDVRRRYFQLFYVAYIKIVNARVPKYIAGYPPPPFRNEINQREDKLVHYQERCMIETHSLIA